MINISGFTGGQRSGFGELLIIYKVKQKMSLIVLPSHYNIRLIINLLPKTDSKVEYNNINTVGPRYNAVVGIHTLSTVL